jgi:hypothetical protein
MAEILQNAIRLIKQGEKQAARGMLEGLLRDEPNQVAHWFWYAETLDTPQERVKVLELCLKANPGNTQTEKALGILRAKISPPTSAQAIDARLDVDWDEADDSAGEPASSDWDTPAFSSAPQSKPAFDWDALENQSAAPKVEAGADPPEFSWEDEQEQPERGVVWGDDEILSGAPSELGWDSETSALKADAPINWDAIEQAQQPARPKALVVASEPVKKSTKKKKTSKKSDTWLVALLVFLSLVLLALVVLVLFSLFQGNLFSVVLGTVG